MAEKKIGVISLTIDGQKYELSDPVPIKKAGKLMGEPETLEEALEVIADLERKIWATELCAKQEYKEACQEYEYYSKRCLSLIKGWTGCLSERIKMAELEYGKQQAEARMATIEGLFGFAMEDVVDV